MKTILIPLFILFAFLAPKTQSYVHKEDIKTINIIPLGNVNSLSIKITKNALEEFYGYKCVVHNSEKLSNDLLSKSGRRYDARKILKKYNSDKNILIITEKDIITKLRGIEEWGILGLGIRPGKVCVVSTYRMNKGNNNKFHDRLTKVSIHEVGHNLGLDHCKNHSKCLMNDANGTVSKIDSEKIWMCEKCSRQIGRKFKHQT